jgi:uncharacterized protein (UPF0335 family)
MLEPMDKEARQDDDLWGVFLASVSPSPRCGCSPSAGPRSSLAVRMSAQLAIPVALPEEHRAADDRLRLLIERIERLEEEKKGISDDIREVYRDMKSAGYDAGCVRQIVRLRRMRPDDRREMEAVLDVYKNALGID